jgi:hypothetical protein
MLCSECLKSGKHREAVARLRYRSPDHTSMNDFYSAAARSFQEGLDRIERDGRQDSPDWHLARGLLELTQGLQQAREEDEALRKSFARSSACPR